MYFLRTNPTSCHLSFSEIPLWWKYSRPYRSDESLDGHNVVSAIMYLIIQAGYCWMDYVKNLDISSVIQRYISIQKKIWLSNLSDSDSKKNWKCQNHHMNSISSSYLKWHSAEIFWRRETEMILQDTNEKISLISEVVTYQNRWRI